jgi:hypothetical protein
LSQSLEEGADVADHARTTPLLDPYDLFPKGAPSISGAVADMTFIMRRDGSLQSGIVDVGESGMGFVLRWAAPHTVDLVAMARPGEAEVESCRTSRIIKR